MTRTTPWSVQREPVDWFGVDFKGDPLRVKPEWAERFEEILRNLERTASTCATTRSNGLSSKLVEMDRSSLPIEVEEGLGRRSAVAEAILWEEQETEIVMFVISCLLLANYESLQL
jgi:hypothetical protein